MAVITGLVLRNLGEHKQPRAFSDILGALFFHIMAMGLFPYASQSLFLYDRQFYQGENGGTCVSEGYKGNEGQNRISNRRTRLTE